QEIKKVGKITVEFKVDKAIKEGLKNGNYIRKGGVIIKKADHTVVKWLKEVKIAKAGKALNIATVALDVVSEIALNEKLKEIQAKLETIEEYSVAEHWHSFLDGSSSLTAAIRLTENNDHRKQLLYDARRSFESAKNKNTVLLNKKIEKIDLLYDEFLSAKIDNHRVAEKIFIKIKEVFPIVSLIVQCCRAQARIFEQLNDLINARAMSQEALDFMAGVHEYLYLLTKGRVLEKKRKEVWDGYVNLSKKFFWPGLIYKKVLKKDLPLESISPEFYFAKWRGKKKFDLLISTEEDLIKEHDRLSDELLFLTFEASDSDYKRALDMHSQ
ncbi:MAG: hypothetical protein KAW56_07255, partial [Candidatus Marinimicrobia bacterium]|nr:hypothetical protein [Candidatus Neomarinimicrobiota bacterium]